MFYFGILGSEVNPLYIFDLGEEVSLGNAGGKGLNLHLLVQAGFNVPSGFIISTAAYKKYVESNGLVDVIEKSLEVIEGVDTLQVSSQGIREAFTRGNIPSSIRNEIISAYKGYARAQPLDEQSNKVQR